MARWQLERDGAVAVLRYHDPPGNLFGPETLRELGAWLDELAEPSGVRVIVLTGSDTVFGGGLDLRQLPRTEPALREMLAFGAATAARIERSPVPVLAAIEGACFGGACELALACHVRLAAETARLALPEIIFGIVPAGGGTQVLPRLIGRGRALRYLLTGASVTGAEAARIGLVDVAAAEGRALIEARKIAKRIARMDPRAVHAILELVDLGSDGTAADRRERVQAWFLAIAASPEGPIPAVGIGDRERFFRMGDNP